MLNNMFFGAAFVGLAGTAVSISALVISALIDDIDSFNQWVENFQNAVGVTAICTLAGLLISFIS